MELLEEYQVALKKIEKLEKQLKECREVVGQVEQGLESIGHSLDHASEFLSPNDPQEKLINDVLFGTPRRLLSIMNEMLHTPFLEGEAKDEAKRKIAKSSLDLFKSKLEHMQALFKQ